MSEKKGFLQLVRFGLVGVLNTLVDLVVTRVFMALMPLLTSAVLLTYYIPKVLGYGCGILNSYLLNSNWTFREEKRKDLREILSFLGVNLITLLISLLLMWLTRDVLGLAEQWNVLFADTFLGKIVPGEFFCTVLSSGIALVINFIGNKFFVFGKRKQDASIAEEPKDNE